MQRQRHLVDLGQLVHRRLARSIDPVLGDAVTTSRRLHLRVVRIEQQVELGVEEVVLVLGCRSGRDAVGVVEEQADVAQPADTGLRAHRGHADLDARVAHGALLGLARAVVEVDLLVRAAADAHAPAAALVLVDQHDAVLAALVHRTRRAGRDAGRIQAVLADARQVEHERLLELHLHAVADLVLDLDQHRVLRRELRAAGQVVIPVGRPLDLHVLAGDERLGTGHRRVLAQGRGQEHVVLVGPGLVVVLHRAGGWGC